MAEPAATTSPSSPPMARRTTSMAAGAPIAVVLAGLLLSVPAAAQTTIFTTNDFHQDRDRWTDPAYYENNTVGQLRGMGINFDSGGRGSGQEASARAYGSKGTGRVGALNLASPYPFRTAR